MTTRFSSSVRTAAYLLIASVAVGSAFAQTVIPGTISGTYVFSERGLQSSTLAWLIFGADGSATGNAVIRRGAAVTTYGLQGTYTGNADGSKIITLGGASLDAVDENGNPLLFSEVMMAIPTSAVAYGTLHPAGQDLGELIPAVAGVIPAGNYQITGKPVDGPDLSVELVNVDSAGSVTGQKVTNAFGVILQKSLRGNAGATPAAFQRITVGVTFTDADGNPQNATEVYMALQTQKDIRMIQVSGGSPSLLTLSK